MAGHVHRGHADILAVAAGRERPSGQQYIDDLDFDQAARVVVRSKTGAG
ncbi:hypothetical protein [Microtetraspora malaysiensis]|nr:hypothetical protein [Microtetraspora malaysiensis]